MIKNEEFAAFSSLGIKPICDNCKRELVLGESVRQSFKGKVEELEDTKELVVTEEEYSLVHVSCFQRT